MFTLGILFCVGTFKVGPNAHGEKIISENCIPVRSITMLISEIDTTNYMDCLPFYRKAKMNCIERFKSPVTAINK